LLSNSTLLHRSFKALEDRIGRDAGALEAARSREERLTAMINNAEHEKLLAFAAAQRSEARG
jgi:hypothetical protein